MSCLLRIVFFSSLLLSCCPLLGYTGAINPYSNLTNRLQNEGFNFIVYGDTRADNPDDGVASIHEELVSTYLEYNPEFIIHTGDMILQGGDWNQWLRFNASLDAVWAAAIPFFGVPGNHEKYTPIWTEWDYDFSNYTTFFDFSSVLNEPGETELWYSFEYGDLHFCFLNTEYYWYDAGGGSMRFSCNVTQFNWLKEDLSKTQLDDFIVVSFHRPAWSVLLNRPDRWEEAESVRANFRDLFVQYGVDLVFSGHDHYYYQTVRNGTYYFTTGGGGAPLYQADLGAPIWQEGDMTFSELHFCNVEVQSTYVAIVAIGPENTIYDAFRIDRPTPPPPPIFPVFTPADLFWIAVIVILAILMTIVYFKLQKVVESTRD